MLRSAGLYIHIPFCEKKCQYCDFYSLTRLDRIDTFVEALLGEIELRAPEVAHHKFTTLFWGGGTPSLLPESQVKRIWNALHQHFQIEPHGETSIEANPGTLTPEKLDLLRALGFNRLSLGVQSFNPEELKFLGRIHGVNEVFENFGHAREAGFQNINLDLMTAFPGITPASFLYSLEQAVSLKPEHISCYTLIFEPGTVFYKKMLRGSLHPLPEDQEACYYQIAREFLAAHGYQQYEISNFALGTFFICRHNLIYWKHHPYIGLGPSAHSFYNHQRWGNHRSLIAYIRDIKQKKLPVAFQENLSEETLMFEYIFLNLRLRQGIDLEEFNSRFGVDLQQKYRSTLKTLLNERLVERQDNYLRLSDTGWMVADTVATYF